MVRIGGDQHDCGAIALEVLHGGLFIRDAGDHKVARISSLLNPSHDVVTVKNPGVHHRVTSYPEHEQLTVAGELGRKGERFLHILGGDHIGAGSDVTHEGDVSYRSTFDRCATGRVEADLDGSRFAGVPTDESPILERGQVGVDGRR